LALRVRLVQEGEHAQRGVGGRGGQDEALPTPQLHVEIVVAVWCAGRIRVRDRDRGRDRGRDRDGTVMARCHGVVLRPPQVDTGATRVESYQLG